MPGRGERSTFVAVGGGGTVAHVQRALQRHGGRVVPHGPVDLWAAFEDAPAALGAARAAREAASSGSLAIAVHSGPADVVAGGGRGAALELTAVVLDAANPGQTLVTAAAREAAGPAASNVVDLGLYQLAELIEPVRLFALVDDRAADAVRPPRARRLRLGSVPTDVPELLGRDEEADAVVFLLERSRVVTLTGVGGIGKTRLAVEIAERIGPEVRDGVWLARLETCSSRADVTSTVLSALGVDGRRPTRRAIDALVAGLTSRQALVVLDNCEHVLPVVGDIVSAVLERCADVRVLATSREPLGLAGERVHRVQPLDTADDGPAASLFLERAAAAGADARGLADPASVGAICRRLEGIPLALELAAARCRSVHPCDVLTRLDDMFAVLGEGPRDGPRRHRSLAAALRWSYDLLPIEQQELLARASVFAGSFGLDAATAVCAGPSADDVLVLLDRLVARSLVVPVEGGRSTRYRLLEPVRQFARDELVRTGDVGATRARHTEWFVRLLADLGARWRAGDDQGTWPVAADELANLRVAFDHLVETRRIDDAERFVVDGYGPVEMHVDPAPEREWAPRALAIDPDHVGPATAAACAVAAWGMTDPSDPDAATACLRRGEAAIERGSVDDGLLVAAAMHQLLFGCRLATSPGFVEAASARAAASDDLHRQVWVFAYTADGERALQAAERLGNVALITLARLSLARAVASGTDSEVEWAAIEELWDAAEGSSCPILVNHAAQMLGDARIRAGTVIDGLLLLRAPLRDWYLDADPRVWDVLQSVADGLAFAGDAVGAARLGGAIGAHRTAFATAARPEETRARVDATLGSPARRRHERDGRAAGLGAIVAEAVERIEAAARRVDAPASRPPLTARQREIADLVARGLTNKQIARALGVSRFTVETHVRNILERLGVASRAQIAVWAATSAHT